MRSWTLALALGVATISAAPACSKSDAPADSATGKDAERSEDDGSSSNEDDPSGNNEPSDPPPIETDPEPALPEPEPSDFDLSAIPESDRFPYGTQAGDPMRRGAVLWTRYTGDNDLTLAVYQATDAGQAKIFVDEDVNPVNGGTVHFDATTLPSGRAYNYVFIEYDTGSGAAVARSPVGRFVTAPWSGKKPVVRFGGTSCTSNSNRPFETLKHAGTQDLDFFILAGDMTYADGSETRAEYRAKWEQQLADPGYRALMGNTAHFSTWDDHEVDDNWDPETIPSDIVEAATDEFFANLAIRRNTGDPSRVWRSYRWGDSLEVFVLDSRSERLPSTRKTDDAQYISPEQLAWLKDGLKNTPAVFKIIVTSVPISYFPGVFDGDHPVAAGDRWPGYASQRRELIEFIGDHEIEGILFVAGDLHLGSSQTVDLDGPGAKLREILMGPGGQWENPFISLLQPPQFDYAGGINNYTVFEADPNATPPTIKVSFIDEDGDEIYVATYSF